MKPNSLRQKGQRFERFVANEIEASGLGEAHREVMSGAGFRKGDIACNLPFLIECKNQKSIRFLDWVAQAKSQAEQGNFDADKWALIVRDPESTETKPNCYAIIDMWEFFKLCKKDKEPLIKQPDKEVSWKIKSAINSLKSLLKELEQ